MFSQIEKYIFKKDENSYGKYPNESQKGFLYKERIKTDELLKSVLVKEGNEDKLVKILISLGKVLGDRYKKILCELNNEINLANLENSGITHKLYMDSEIFLENGYLLSILDISICQNILGGQVFSQKAENKAFKVVFRYLEKIRNLKESLVILPKRTKGVSSLEDMLN